MSKVTSDKISQAEAERLLKMLKYSSVKTFTFPTRGSKECFEVSGDDGKDVFVIYVNRRSIKRLKYEFEARIQNKTIMLLELHIGATNKHYNPGEENAIVGDHWHIYLEGEDRGYAYPAENINSEDFVENTILFLKKFNVIDPPEIYSQEELKD